ncbi:hypothetical protein KKB99_08110 [bacterium]|nr:hypothetical protein [bacterium]MBU1025954.1 hypothetical protein [bacterium]
MKKSIIIPLALLVLFNLSFSCFSDHSSSDAKKTAELWASYTDSSEIKYLHVLFDSIRFKKEKKFEDALEAFISLETPYSSENIRPQLLSSPGKAHAIYTLATIGGDDISQKFNDLLTDKLIPKQGIYLKQYDEKSEALKFMYDLGLTPEPETIEYLRNELKGNEDPPLVLKMITLLMLHGYKLTEDEKEYISELITTHPQNVKGSDILKIGIQPDWEEMLEKSDTRLRARILEMLLIAGDTESKKRFIEQSGDVDSYKGKLATIKTVIAASIGNEKAINILKKSMNHQHVYLISAVPEYFSDEVLLGSLEFCLKNSFQMIEGEFLEVLTSRGYRVEVENYINENIKVIKNNDLDDLTGWSEHARSVRILLSYDSYSLMHLLSELFESNETIQNAMMLTSMITDYGSEEKNYRNSDEKSGIEKWISENPEIIVKLISTILNFQPDTENILEQSLRTRTCELAFPIMLYLPENIFHKNFTQLDKENICQASILLENYYNVDRDSEL